MALLAHMASANVVYQQSVIPITDHRAKVRNLQPTFNESCRCEFRMSIADGTSTSVTSKNNRLCEVYLLGDCTKRRDFVRSLWTVNRALRPSRVDCWHTLGRQYSAPFDPFSHSVSRSFLAYMATKKMPCRAILERLTIN